MSYLMTGKNPGNGCPRRVALAVLIRMLPLLLVLLFLGSCKKESYPKPIAYPRIAYPAASYQRINLPDKPYSFEYPSYATIVDQSHANKNWLNLRFKSFGATLYMSMNEVAPILVDTMLLEKERLVYEQAPSVSAVRKEAFEASDHRYTGYFYLIDGNVPSPVQFILSDHRGKIFQGSLLFDLTANRDSLASVVGGLTRDVRHLVETFQFKN